MPLSTDKPKRATANPNPKYDDDPNRKLLEEQLEDEQPGDGNLSDVTTDDEQDTLYRGRATDGASDGERSDDESDDAYASDEDSSARRHSRKLSPEHRQAIKIFCQFMRIAVSDFPKMRRGIRYVVDAIHHSDEFAEVVRDAYRRLQWETPASEENLTKIIAIAEPMAKSEQIAVHCEAIGQAFGRLAEFNGGFFTTVSRNIPVLYGIALMAQMVDALPEFLANGSAQETGFAMLLNLHGLQGDAPAMLASAFSTDTAIDSVRATARTLVENLAAVPQAERLAALLGQLAQFPTVGDRERAARAANGVKSYYNHCYYDRPPTNNKGGGPPQHKLNRVIWSLVIRAPPKAAPPEAAPLEAQTLRNFTASKGGEEDFNYAPLKHLRVSPTPSADEKLALERQVAAEHPGIPSDLGYEVVTREISDAREVALKEATVKWRAEKKRQDVDTFGPLQVVFRAETLCTVPGYTDAGWTGMCLYDAMRSLLVNDPNQGEQLLAPKLKEYLDYAYPQYRNTPWGFPLLPGVFVGFRKNGRDVRTLGRSSPNRRTLARGVEDATVDGSLAMWIAMEQMTITQFVNLIPPWLLYTPGVWECYLYIDQGKAPSQIFSHTRVCRMHRLAFDANNARVLQRARTEAMLLMRENFKYALMQHTFTEHMVRPKRKLQLTEAEKDEMEAWVDGEMPEDNPRANYEEEMVAEAKADPDESGVTVKGYRHTYFPLGLVQVNYPNNSNIYPVDHPGQIEKAGQRRFFYPSQKVAHDAKIKAAKEKRAADEATAKKYLKGLETADAATAAEPGGSAYQEAAEHFEGMAAQEPSASEAAGPATA